MTAPAFAADLRRLIRACRIQAAALIDMIQAYRLRRPPPAEWGPVELVCAMSPRARQDAVDRLLPALVATVQRYRFFKLALKAADRRMPA